MNKTFAARLQFCFQFRQVSLDHFWFRVDQRIEAENEIDRTRRNHRQRTAVVQKAADARIVLKPLTTRCHTIFDSIDRDEQVTVIAQVMGPPSKAHAYFENCRRRQPISNSRKNRARPLRGRSPPRHRPLFAGIFPVVGHLASGSLANNLAQVKIEMWLGAESNRRHVDFQSTALPTELPSRTTRENGLLWAENPHRLKF